MARHRLILPVISLATVDKQIAQAMEPRTSTPQARLRAIQELTSAGIPTGVLIAPIIPGLTDSSIPETLREAYKAGDTFASRNVLRLPLSVEPVFLDWLHHHFPLQEERVLSRIRQVRNGELNSAAFGERMAGSGVIADQINQTCYFENNLVISIVFQCSIATTSCHLRHPQAAAAFLSSTYELDIAWLKPCG